MPNWCENSIEISHDDPKMIKKFVEAFNKEEVGNTFRPQPENLFKGNLGKSEMEMCEQQGIPNWYDWNYENWGVKWDFGCDGQKEEWDGSNNLSVFFMTPWGPPIVLYEYMTSEHRFHIVSECMEVGMGFLGKWESGDSEGKTRTIPTTRDELSEIEFDYPMMYSSVECEIESREDDEEED
tara:strand:- start:2836 stop:3378 length:543 start_codon:yes stop_codon:yes gene_type:complete